MSDIEENIKTQIIARLVNVHKQYGIPLNSLLKSFNLDHFIEHRLKQELTALEERVLTNFKNNVIEAGLVDEYDFDCFFREYMEES